MHSVAAWVGKTTVTICSRQFSSVGVTDHLTTCEFVVVYKTVHRLSYVASDLIDRECDIRLSHLGEHDGLMTVTCEHV